jgi:hypothetical protein
MDQENGAAEFCPDRGPGALGRWRGFGVEVFVFEEERGIEGDCAGIRRACVG